MGMPCIIVNDRLTSIVITGSIECIYVRDGIFCVNVDLHWLPSVYGYGDTATCFTEIDYKK